MFEDFWLVFTWAAIVAVVATAITCTIIVTRYKKKLKAPIYPIDKYASLSLSVSRDDFIGSTVTKVRVASKKK